MTPLSMSLGGGALGVGIGLLCGCPDRAFKYGIVGLFAGGLVGKVAEKKGSTTIAGADPDWWREALANNPYGHSPHMRRLAERDRAEGYLPGGDDPYIEGLPGQGLKPDFEVVRHDGAVLDGATGRITGRIRPGMPFEPGPLHINDRYRRDLPWRSSRPPDERWMDRQPFPRGDWSGDPSTRNRPHSHIGGDLPPFHPWLNFSREEREHRWAMGDRPENHEPPWYQGARVARPGHLPEPVHMIDQYGVHHMDRDGEIVTGFQCPEGFDLVSADHQIACAFRGQSSCLAGSTDASGQFICTQRDFECPPGMFTRRGSPSNWCFPSG